MKVFSCAAARRRLDAFHDRELTVADQIAVGAHLEWCDECAAVSADMRLVGATLREAAPGRMAVSHEIEGFNSLVLARLKAERDTSFRARFTAMFDDLHLVYAGVGATVATAVCLVLVVGMMRFATNYRPDSLAATLDVMASPFGCETGRDVPDALACRARWAERFDRATRTAEQDAVFTLDAVVMYDGQLANLAVLRASRHDSASDQAEVIEELLDTVSRARSMPQQTELSASLLRIVARETVRPKPASLDTPHPSGRPAASKVPPDGLIIA